MLTVKTYLAPSQVHGIGLYAAEPIPSGSVIWRFSPHIDKIFSTESFIGLCAQMQGFSLQHLLCSSYRRGGRYFYLTDNTRFINHSSTIDNIRMVSDFEEIATRDIATNEELLENYHLAYDSNDFFFQEMINPDPLHYLYVHQGGHHAHA